MKLLIATPVLDSNIGGMERFVIEFSTTPAGEETTWRSKASGPSVIV